MASVETLFVDWRPIASVPIHPGIMACEDWQSAALIFHGTALENAEIRYRYICRNDGIIVF